MMKEEEEEDEKEEKNKYQKAKFKGQFNELSKKRGKRKQAAAAGLN